MIWNICRKFFAAPGEAQIFTDQSKVLLRREAVKKLRSHISGEMVVADTRLAQFGIFGVRALAQMARSGDKTHQTFKHVDNGIAATVTVQVRGEYAEFKDTS